MGNKVTIDQVAAMCGVSKTYVSSIRWQDFTAGFAVTILNIINMCFQLKLRSESARFKMEFWLHYALFLSV